jgi:hypothetical protein
VTTGAAEGCPGDQSGLVSGRRARRARTARPAGRPGQDRAHPLFYNDKTAMLLGDAKASVGEITEELNGI